ncbi:hypothetical protein [Clostridium perfringens]|uniref:hypothetical protein n=1 Tax=Clostridium perfringens TaxID=1502 RepID=UPI0024BD1F53|nr:hypothetical protein [Clostridium perfringens]
MNLNKFNYNSQRIKDYIEYLSINFDEVSFYPRAISNVLNLELHFVISELNNLIGRGIIDLKFEIRTTDDLKLIKIVDRYYDILNQKICCSSGETFIITEKNIYPIYFINKEYKDYIQKYKK